jgi:hypothetical protein
MPLLAVTTAADMTQRKGIRDGRGAEVPGERPGDRGPPGPHPVADGPKLRFRQEPDRAVIRGLPARCPDKVRGIGMLKLELAGQPRQEPGEGPVIL